ncbi:hypothetical protein BANRA_04354 [Pseudomonas aeruginosa]|nr:hypothetical protein [Pseudomonas aeruginosa]VCW38437.1 hypothetical protein BANRA_05463 [Pseudomonas aeruginosa]VCX92312.1 hypothetical protein BANRA_03240 [Pseudomonas aeruginosa]VDK98904.1 hypothetical protein BANRA_04354 [Pseudomonas aeruginosa]
MRWRCSERRDERDSAGRAGLAAGGAGTGDPAAPGLHAAVDRGHVARLRGLAGAGLPHACRLSARLGQAGPGAARRGRGLVVARQPGGPGRGGGAADRRVHPQAGGNEDPPRCAGTGVPRFLRSGGGLPVRRRFPRRAVQPAAGDRVAGGADRLAAERFRQPALADPAAGRRAVAAGAAADAPAVPVLPPPGAAVVVADARQQGGHRTLGEHGARGYRRAWALRRTGVPGPLRGRTAAARAALLARLDHGAFRRTTLGSGAAMVGRGCCALAEAWPRAALRRDHAAQFAALAVRPRRGADRPDRHAPDERFPPAAAAAGRATSILPSQFLATGAARVQHRSAHALAQPAVADARQSARAPWPSNCARPMRNRRHWSRPCCSASTASPSPTP